MYEALSSYYSIEDNEDTLNIAKSRIPTSKDVVDKVLNNLCAIYSQGIDRNIDNELFERIDYKLQDVHKTALFTGSCLVRPYFISKDEIEFDLYSFTPDMYRTVYKDFELNEVWIVKPTQGENEVEISTTNDVKHPLEYNFRVWEKRADGIYKVTRDNRGGLIEEEKSRYDFIPFIELKTETTNYHYSDGGLYSLLELQANLNERDYVIQNNIFDSGLAFNIGINLGLKDGEQDIKLSRRRLHTIENVRDTQALPEVMFNSAQFLGLELRDERTQFLREKILMFGLPANLVNPDGTLQSGIAMAVERSELFEFREQQLGIIKNFDYKLFKLIEKVANKDGVKVDFKDYSFSTARNEVIKDKKEDWDYDLQLYDKGLITIEQLAERHDIEITQEQINQNLKDKNGNDLERVGASNNNPPERSGAESVITEPDIEETRSDTNEIEQNGEK